MKHLLTFSLMGFLLGCVSTRSDSYQQAADALFPENEQELNVLIQRRNSADDNSYADFRNALSLCITELGSVRKVVIPGLSHFTRTDAAIDLLECVGESGWRVSGRGSDSGGVD